MILGKILEVDGNDLVVSVTLRDSSNNDIISGQTVTASIRRLETISSNDRYWNSGTSDFDLLTEPTLDAVVQGVIPGTYQLRLVGGFDAAKTKYSVHIVITGTPETADFHQFVTLEINPDNTNIGLIKAEVVDTIAELSAGIPPKNPKLAQAVMLSYMALRNGVFTGFDTGQSKNLTKIKNDAGDFITQKEFVDDATNNLFESEKIAAPL